MYIGGKYKYFQNCYPKEKETKMQEKMTEWAYRAWRTFIQTATPSIVLFISAYGTSQTWDWKLFWFTVLVPAISTTLAALMNIKTTDSLVEQTDNGAHEGDPTEEVDQTPTLDEE